MQDGYKLRGLLPGGASTDFLTPEHYNIKMDFEEVAKAGSRMGTGTIIVMDDKTCPVGMCSEFGTVFLLKNHADGVRLVVKDYLGLPKFCLLWKKDAVRLKILII
jgi:hypothetical protein